MIEQYENSFLELRDDENLLWPGNITEKQDLMPSYDLLNFDSVSELIKSGCDNISNAHFHEDQEFNKESEKDLESNIEQFNEEDKTPALIQNKNSTKSENSGLKSKESLKEDNKGESKVNLCMNRKDVVIKR